MPQYSFKLNTSILYHCFLILLSMKNRFEIEKNDQEPLLNDTKRGLNIYSLNFVISWSREVIAFDKAIDWTRY